MKAEDLKGTYADMLNKPVEFTDADYKIYLYRNTSLAGLNALRDLKPILVRLSNEESINHSGVALGLILDTEKRKAINPKFLKYICLDSERDLFPEYFV